MPYDLKKENNKWIVWNPDTKKVYGRHSSKAKARAQQKALYASAPPEKEE